MGVYPGFQPAALPANPGLEGMGHIIAVGENVTNLAVGQKVVPFFIFGKDYLGSGKGSWKQYVEMDSKHVFPIPEGIPDTAAAQFVVNPFTALQMIRSLNIPKHEYLIQTAAGSALGKQVIQMCRALEIRTINIVRRSESIPELTALGADHVLLQTDDIAAKVKEITNNNGAYAGLDAVGGDLTIKITNSIRNAGTLIIYGAMSGLTFTGSIIDALFRNVTVRGYWVTTDAVKIGIEQCHELANELWGMMTSKKLTLENFAGTVYPIAQVKEAVLAHAQAGRNGKVMMTFNS